jgi:hypothetical protein
VNQTPTNEDFFKQRWVMLETDGWRSLVDDLQAMNDSLNTIYAAEDEKSLNFIKGQLSILNMLITLEEQTKLVEAEQSE